MLLWKGPKMHTPSLTRPGVDRSRVRRGRGFTLVELLVVIGIIALLVGLLLPALAAVREQGKITQTRSLMKNLGDAVDSFVLTHNRRPGPLSERQHASDSNYYSFISGTENALLELMGGLTQNGTDVFDLAGLTIYRDDIGLGPTINGVKYDAYFKPNPRDLYYVNGQDGGSGGQQNVDNNRPQDGARALPDLVDAFGTPIIFWPNSGSKPKGLRDINGRPAVVTFNSQSGNISEAAPYYYSSFQSYTNSVGLRVGPSGGSVVNQRTRSLLAATGFSSGGSATRELAQAIASHPTLDSTPRGGYILLSAGKDTIYFDREQVTKPQQGGAWSDNDLKRFDDIIQYGGS